MKKSIYSAKQRKLSDFLKKARQKAGVTQGDLARHLSKPQSFIAKYEGGERRLDLIELLEISAILNIDIKNLIKEIDRIG